MKFFHLSDLHIGRQLHHYNLREDQERILGEVIDYAELIHPDSIIIDAKSILGVLSMDLSRVMTVKCYGEDKNFNKTIAKFAVV